MMNEDLESITLANQAAPNDGGIESAPLSPDKSDPSNTQLRRLKNRFEASPVADVNMTSAQEVGQLRAMFDDVAILTETDKVALDTRGPHSRGGNTAALASELSDPAVDATLGPASRAGQHDSSCSRMKQ